MSFQPKRGDEVAAWIKRTRDEYCDPRRGCGCGSSGWTALDELLDDYRLHADTGTPLAERVRMHEGEDLYLG